MQRRSILTAAALAALVVCSTTAQEPKPEIVEPKVRVWVAPKATLAKDGKYVYHCFQDRRHLNRRGVFRGIEKEEGELLRTGTYRLCEHCLEALEAFVIEEPGGLVAVAKPPPVTNAERPQ
jgi:hypothetical protein